MNTFHIKPTNPEAIIRDPITRRPLTAGGEEKPKDHFWMRRLRDGDVQELTKKEIADLKKDAAPSKSTSGGDA